MCVHVGKMPFSPYGLQSRKALAHFHRKTEAHESPPSPIKMHESPSSPTKTLHTYPNACRKAPQMPCESSTPSFSGLVASCLFMNALFTTLLNGCSSSSSSSCGHSRNKHNMQVENFCLSLWLLQSCVVQFYNKTSHMRWLLDIFPRGPSFT